MYHEKKLTEQTITCSHYQICKKHRDCCINNASCYGCAMPDYYTEIASCGCSPIVG
ncbi:MULTISPECIES: hypothetical protein [Bacillus]|uniref:hypothetical protein n=1 Tax=Bacillus TaxID=1386 RepID=UPI0002E31974|nr:MULTISPECIES: hypothetical protein [Bacillus]COD98801.1 Uncharacterised protein [Streptococcus pneumoniae]AJI36066.1 hypothetical protein BG06_1503 [Bacillus thuringiensis]MCC0759445.1 hypothetical protein [Bacillus sp. BRTN]MCC0769905.1 hypothetical protein [Bacillus pacificus]MCU5386095.1 hypothetical protein [Bacillus cereus]